MEQLIYFLINNAYLYWSVIIVLLIVDIILAIISMNRKKREDIKKEFKEAEKEVEQENIIEEKVTNQLQDIIMQMKQDMEVKPEEVVAKFEEEQEKNAIISYQELVESVRNGKIETVDDEDLNIDYVKALDNDIDIEPIVEVDSNEPTREELQEVIDKITKTELTEDIKEESKEKSKFKSTDFISPVFGRMNAEVHYPKINTTTEIEKMFNIDKIKDEVEKNEAFLNALIDFRNNL